MKTDTLKYILKSLVLLVWIIISGYICIGGLSMIESIEKVKPIQNKVELDIIRNITMFQGSTGMLPAHGEDIIMDINENLRSKNKEQLTFEEEEAINYLAHVYWYYGYPKYSFIRVITILPYIVLLFLTVGTTGLLGSVVKKIYDHINQTVLLKDSKYISVPVFGFFLGIMVLAISYIIPTVFVRGDTTVNMTSVVFLCFFSGIYNKRFFEWISNLISKVLNPPKSTSE